MNTFEPCYIVSLDNGLSPGQEARTDSIVRAMLETERVPYKPVVGCYKGKTENSMVIPGAYRKRVMQLAHAHHQESVLHLDANRVAHLIYMDGRPDETLGRWREVAPGEEPDAWTLDPKTGRMWTAGPAS